MRPRIINLLAISSVVLGMLSVFVAYHGRGGGVRTDPPMDVILPQVTFREKPLAEAFQSLRESSGVNIVVDWKSLAKWNITEQSPVSLDLHDVSLPGALEAMLDEFPSRIELGYHLDHDVICVDGMSRRPETSPRLEARVYDVRDLIDLPDPPAPATQTAARATYADFADTAVSGIAFARSHTSPARESPDDIARDFRLSRLIALLDQPKMPRNVDGWSGRLFVIDTHDHQLEIQKTLAELRGEARRTRQFPIGLDIQEN
jgi:hypothetical protein